VYVFVLLFSSVEADFTQLPLNQDEMQLTWSFNLVFNCLYCFISLNNSWFRGFFNPIYLLELKPKYTNNTASSASCPELHTEKVTVRVIWEQTFLIKKMIYISILWIFHVFQLHLHIDYQLKGCSSISVACRGFSG
jgi:hypothetical protein